MDKLAFQTFVFQFCIKEKELINDIKTYFKKYVYSIKPKIF